MSKLALEKLQTKFGDQVVLETDDWRGDETAVIAAEKILDVARFLRDDSELKMEMLVDLTAVDYLAQGRRPRFEVVYHLHSLSRGHRLRFKVRLDEASLIVDSLVTVWPIANWLEREVYDLYGIRFRGHPHLRRILLYDQFEGHPLRKDYPKEKRQPLVRRPENEIAEALARRKEALTVDSPFPPEGPRPWLESTRVEDFPPQVDPEELLATIKDAEPEP